MRRGDHKLWHAHTLSSIDYREKTADEEFRKTCRYFSGLAFRRIRGLMVAYEKLRVIYYGSNPDCIMREEKKPSPKPIET